MHTLLIVEDEQDLREVYEKIFTDAQFRVETAKDGREAIEKLVSFIPEVVLLDLMMPHVDGFDVLKQIKSSEKTKNTKVIILTNVFADTDDLVKNGALAVWLKTDYTPQQLVDEVKKVI